MRKKKLLFGFSRPIAEVRKYFFCNNKKKVFLFSKKNEKN